MQLTYERYHDAVLGGWLGKCIGGTIGARFEGNKSWIELDPKDFFPDKIPPNDDLDLQILWLKVLEEKGDALTGDDLAAAWHEHCWYPFNEYGIFRRNWQLGIHPPESGRYGNAFWESGMGCPIRSEIWGYVFPGAPDLAARYAWIDGTLDHTEQSVGAEQMLAAMASMAFFVPDVRRLAAMFRHYLPAGTPIERLTTAAFDCHATGVPLRQARERLMAIAGHPEACDAQINVPFTFLGLLYGENDLEKTMLAALHCGYDTDCTLATSAALIGQILGARRIPEHLKQRIGDELVMGIQYRRPDMRISVLARDTARIGVLLSGGTGIEITGAPDLAPLPTVTAGPRLSVEYHGMPATTPGEPVRVTVKAEALGTAMPLHLETPDGWSVTPADATLSPLAPTVDLHLHPSATLKHWPMRNLVRARLGQQEHTFGVVGEALWMLLGVHYDPVSPTPLSRERQSRRMQHHFVDLAKPYLPEPELDIDELFEQWSQKLGRPALIRGTQSEVDITQLIGLRGPCVVYLARRIVSPEERDGFIAIGNSGPFRVYLNGQLIADDDECTWWTPFNHEYPVKLRQGVNTLLVKLVRPGDELRFSLAFRHTSKPRPWMNGNDWMVDLADVNPLAR